MSNPDGKQETARQKILIVDDKLANLFALEKLLKDLDADVIRALDGQTALEQVLNHDFALIILDVRMPGMDGYEVAGHLQGDNQTNNIPIIFVTAEYPDEEHIFKGYEAGAIDYLLKPYSPRILLSKVNILLEMARNNQELQHHRDNLEKLVAARTAELCAANKSLEESRVAALNMMEDAVLSKTKLHEALQRQRFHIEHTPLAVIELDINWNICAWNPSAEKIFGWRAEEIIGKNVGIIVANENKPLVDQQMEKLHKQTGGFRVTNQNITKDKQIILCEWHNTVLTDEDGTVTGIASLAMDVTERKRMQEAIEKRILALTRPLEDAGEITLEDLFNLKEIQRIQDEFSAATGVASIITKPDGTPITEPSNFTRLCQHIIRNTEKGCANCIKSDAAIGRVNSDGPTIQLCLSGGLWDAGASIAVGGNHIANWLIGQVRDETQTDEKMRAYAREIGADEAEYMNAFRDVPAMSKKRFEAVSQALFTLASQLSTSAYQNMQQARFIADEKRRSAELLRLSTAINQSPEAVVITDTEGNIEYVNPAFENVTGYTCDEAMGQKPSILQSGQHSDRFYKSLWETLSRGDIWNGRFTNKRKDGSLYTEESVISPVKSPDGTITNYVAIKRDITNELIQEEQLQNTQKMEAIGQLAGGIAHDFNNILQAILGFSELLMLALDSKLEQPRNNVEEIQKAAKHATELTRQLLAFSRSQALELTRADVNLTVKNTLSFMASIIGATVQIKTDLNPELEPVWADNQQLERVLLNITLNARDAMPNGGKLTIRTDNIEFSANDAARSKKIRAGKFIRLSISDTGTGMSKETAKHIFEPFFTTKPPGKGTGLGLSAIYGIIQKHKGWISIHSEMGQGTTFEIFLPTYSAGQSLPLPTDTKPVPDNAHDPREHILIVENDPHVLNLSRNALGRAGYKVKTATVAEDAERLFNEAERPFDLLFINISLADDIVISFKNKQPDLAVLLYESHSVQNSKKTELLQHGFFLLDKPLSVVNLLKQARRAMEQKTPK